MTASSGRPTPPDNGSTGTGSPDTGSSGDRAAHPRKYSKEELDLIFGVDPVSTRDDLPEPDKPREDWYRENTPPHHG